MSRKCYKTEEKYKVAKAREYARYYKATQLYKPRRWTDTEEDLLVRLSTTQCNAQLSVTLSRSIKSIEHRRSILKKRGRM